MKKTSKKVIKKPITKGKKVMSKKGAKKFNPSNFKKAVKSHFGA